MLKISFEINLIDDDVSPFELGNMQITDGEVTIVSLQQMMIFISLSNLLDVLKILFKTRPVRDLEFASVDSYFRLLLGIKKQTLTITDPRSKSIIKVGIDQFASLLYHQVSDFYKPFASSLEDKHDYHDLSGSLKDFERMIKKLGYL